MTTRCGDGARSTSVSGEYEGSIKTACLVDRLPRRYPKFLSPPVRICSKISSIDVLFTIREHGLADFGVSTIFKVRFVRTIKDE